MNKGLLILSGWLLLGSGAAFSQTGARAPEFGEADVEAIEEMYYRYEVAYFASDYPTLRQIVSGPFLTTVRGDKRWQISDTTAEQRLEGLKEMQKRGYSHADITERRIFPLRADLALLYQTYRRWHTNGKSLNEDGASI